jgi:FeS assembly protein IscX
MVQFEPEYAHSFGWEATYEIVLSLMAAHPSADLDALGLGQLQAMILALPGFQDDASLAHEALLCDILREWYEESDLDYFGRRNADVY